MVLTGDKIALEPRAQWQGSLGPLVIPNNSCITIRWWDGFLRWHRLKLWRRDFSPISHYSWSLWWLIWSSPNTNSHSPSSGGHLEGKDSVTGPCSTVRPLGRQGWSGGCCWMLVACRHPQRLEAQAINNPATHMHGRKEKTWMQLVSLNSATSPLSGTGAIS